MSAAFPLLPRLVKQVSTGHHLSRCGDTLWLPVLSLLSSPILILLKIKYENLLPENIIYLPITCLHEDSHSQPSTRLKQSLMSSVSSKTLSRRVSGSKMEAGREEWSIRTSVTERAPASQGSPGNDSYSQDEVDILLGKRQEKTQFWWKCPLSVTSTVKPTCPSCFPLPASVANGEDGGFTYPLKPAISTKLLWLPVEFQLWGKNYYDAQNYTSGESWNN